MEVPCTPERESLTEMDTFVSGEEPLFHVSWIAVSSSWVLAMFSLNKTAEGLQYSGQWSGGLPRWEEFLWWAPNMKQGFNMDKTKIKKQPSYAMHSHSFTHLPTIQLI